MNIKNLKKILRNFIFFIALIIFTFWFIFKDQDFNELLEVIRLANSFYILLGILIMLMYFLMESINIKCILKSFGNKISIFSALKYTLIGFFFSAITPAASGGQPMEIYYMRKDGIPVAHSTLSLLIQLCGFQISTLSLGIICIIINSSLLNGGFIFLFILGVLLNLSALTLLLIGIFSKRLTKKLVIFFIKVLEFFKVKDIDERKEKINAALVTYNESSIYIKTHKNEFIKAILRVFVQVLLYYSIPFIVYKSFGLNEYNILKLISLQAVLYCTTSGIPLPGAIGISEGVFLGIYGTIFGNELLSSAMLLFRGITFYLFVIASQLVVIINSIKTKTKKLRFVELSMHNLKIATDIESKIFPDSNAYYIYKQKVEGKLNNYFSTYIAYLRDIPIGILGLYEIPDYSDTIWLNWFGILPEYRHKGYGKQMLDFIIEQAKTHNKDFLRLYTSEIYNNSASDFYKKHMDLQEDYYNDQESNKEFIKKIKPKIYGKSLNDNEIPLWNNKFIDISNVLVIHKKSIIEINKLS